MFGLEQIYPRGKWEILHVNFCHADVEPGVLATWLEHCTLAVAMCWDHLQLKVKILGSSLEL